MTKKYVLLLLIISVLAVSGFLLFRNKNTDPLLPIMTDSNSNGLNDDQVIAEAPSDYGFLPTEDSTDPSEQTQPTPSVEGASTPTPKGHGKPTPTPSASTTPNPTTTSTPTPSKTPTATPTPSKTPTATATPAPTSTPIQTTGKVWGAYLSGGPESIGSFESLVGHSMNISAVFVGWDTDGEFPDYVAPYVKSKGKTLLIYWEQYGTDLDEINSGAFDNYMTGFAADAKAYGGQIILVPFHEMNGNWDPWDGTVGNNTPAKLISAWKRMHGFFSGVTNVKFGWAVNNVSVPNTTANSIDKYYPGDAYVDYVGVDGFNFNDPWQTYDQVFNSAMAKVKVYNKPVYIFSTASAEGTQKPAWITDFGAKIAADSKIAGWIWFNENKEQNWLVNSTQASLNAFKAILP